MRQVLAILGVLVTVVVTLWVVSARVSQTSPSVPARSEAKPKPNGKMVQVPVVTSPVRYEVKDRHSFSGVVSIKDIPHGRFRDQVAALSPQAREYVFHVLADARIPLADVEALSVLDDGSLIYGCGPNCGHDHSKGGRP